MSEYPEDPMDLWDSVLAGAEEPPPAAPAPDPEPEPEPELEPEAEFVPYILGGDEDVSHLTDDQIHQCMALVGHKGVADSVYFEATDEVLAILGRAYVGRRNPVPIRRPGKTWNADKRTLTRDDFARHLAGKWTLGAYIVDDKNTTGVVVIDIDADGPTRDGMLAGDYLAMVDMVVWTRHIGKEMSVTFGGPTFPTITGGKGAHVIWTPPERVPAWIVRRQVKWMFIRMTMKPGQGHWKSPFEEHLHFECYPKQDEVGDGLGNLIRLPHGTDPGTGRRSLVVTDDESTVQDRPLQPMYRVQPIGGCESSRRQVQALVDTGTFAWLDGFLGSKYEPGLRERCEALTATGVPQMGNAIGQVIHAFAWFDPIHAKGLLGDLEAGVE